MNKKAYFFTDDVIWVFRDLAKHRPKSAFDNPFLAMFKEAHDKYGAKIQLNIFLETDDRYEGEKFHISDMPDIYKDEFAAASDWLKFGLHARSEFPDSPYLNADYEEAKRDFTELKKQILRFASEENFALAMCPHWLPLSYEACVAAKEVGIKLMDVTYGERVPFERGIVTASDEERFLQGTKPHSSLFRRQIRGDRYYTSLAGYNHLNTEECARLDNTSRSQLDEKTGLYFKRYCITHVLNMTKLEDIEPTFKPFMDYEVFCFANHEQYFYSDYFNYLPDYRDRVLKACEYVHENGFEFIFFEDLV